jgi:hypothetical protein
MGGQAFLVATIGSCRRRGQDTEATTDLDGALVVHAVALLAG